jgi:acyl-coenzyme A thioesterase PaaI-like protein
MQPGVGVLTTEFKVNLMSPAAGERLVAKSRVVRSGRTLTVAIAEVARSTESDARWLLS